MEVINEMCTEITKEALDKVHLLIKDFRSTILLGAVSVSSSMDLQRRLGKNINAA